MLYLSAFETLHVEALYISSIDYLYLYLLYIGPNYKSLLLNPI